MMNRQSIMKRFLLPLIVSGAFVYFLIVSRETSKPSSMKTCGQYPDEREIIYDNVIWQVFKTSGGSVKLLNAYLDTRFSQRIVKINSSGPKLNLNKNSIFCQFWFEGHSKPYTVKASEIQSLWTKRKEINL